MGILGNLFDSSKKNTQKEDGCCSVELEPLSDEEASTNEEQSSGRDGGCCGGTGQKEPATVASHT